MEISTCENSRLTLNRAVPDQVSTGSYQNGTRLNRDGEISRKLAFLTERVQKLESKLESQPPIHHESSKVHQQIREQNFKANSYEPTLCSNVKMLKDNGTVTVQRKEGPDFENFAAVSRERNCCKRNDFTAERNTPILIMPVESNKANLARSSFERKKQSQQTFLNTFEPISGTCHNGTEVENNLQSGSFVNSWRSKAPLATKSTNSTDQNFVPQKQRTEFWEDILSGKSDEDVRNYPSSVSPKDVCLQQRHSKEHLNISTSLTKPINELNKTATGCRESLSTTTATTQVPKPHVIEVLSDESSRSNYGYTIRVARQWTKGPGFGRSATLNTHEGLMTPSEDINILKSVQLQRTERLKLNKAEGLAGGEGNKSYTVGSCELRLEPVKLENRVELKPKCQNSVTNGIDYASAQESNSRENERGSKKTFKTKVKLEIAQATQDNTAEKLAQNSAFVSKLSLHRSQNTCPSNLYSRSSDHLTNFYINGDALSSEDGREITGIEGQETDSSFEETDDEKNYSICVTGGGEITLMGSDRFTSSEMSYDFFVKDAIEMQMCSSDTQKAGDKKSIEKGQQNVLNSCSNYHEVVEPIIKNNHKSSSTQRKPSRYQDWTSSDSETVSPRQPNGHRPGRDSRRKVKVTCSEIHTPQKTVIANCNKKKSRDNSPKRKTNRLPETTRTCAREGIRPQVNDFSAEEEEPKEKCHVNTEECLRELIEPEQIRLMPSPVTKGPLSGFGNSPTEGSSGFNENSSLTNGEEEPLIVATRINSVHVNAEGSYRKYPSKNSKKSSTESSADSPYSSFASVNSTLEPEYHVKHPSLNSIQYAKDGHKTQELRPPREENQSSKYFSRDCRPKKDDMPNHNALHQLNDQSNELTNRQMPLSSRDPYNEFLPIISRRYASSPVSSVETSDFSMSDDVFSDCQCRHYCQCQTGILSRDDFKEELKSASHYLLTKRQSMLSNSAKDMRTAKYHLDDEEGEMNLLEYPSKANGRIASKGIPMIVKVILRLRKHFFGNFEHQQLPVKDQNNNPRPSQRDLALTRANTGTKRISFSPSAMLLSAVSESSISEIREVVEKEKVDVNQVSPSGRTLLHKAASAGDIESIRILISYGADVNLTDQHGFPPLNSALAHEHYKCAMFLIEQGTDLNLYTHARIHEYYEVKDMLQRNLKYDLSTIV